MSRSKSSSCQLPFKNRLRIKIFFTTSKLPSFVKNETLFSLHTKKQGSDSRFLASYKLKYVPCLTLNTISFVIFLSFWSFSGTVGLNSVELMLIPKVFSKLISWFVSGSFFRFEEVEQEKLERKSWGLGVGLFNLP